ncbi:MAG TPA: hypothetical protein VJI15_06165 [Candidatus Nanoarchaeia archaeon]|nr:hypothetical protein [Candidatus Nanoarchaeia archaeon]
MIDNKKGKMIESPFVKTMLEKAAEATETMPQTRHEVNMDEIDRVMAKIKKGMIR